MESGGYLDLLLFKLVEHGVGAYAVCMGTGMILGIGDMQGCGVRLELAIRAFTPNIWD